MVLSIATEKKSSVTPPGIDPETVRLVAQCLNHYATPGPLPTVVSLNSVMTTSVEILATYYSPFILHSLLCVLMLTTASVITHRKIKQKKIKCFNSPAVIDV
jgi:hypothetical protein